MIFNIERCISSNDPDYVIWGHELSDIAYACGQDVSELRRIKTNTISGFVADIEAIIPPAEENFPGVVYSYLICGNEMNPRMKLTRIMDENEAEKILIQMSQRYPGLHICPAQ